MYLVHTSEGDGNALSAAVRSESDAFQYSASGITVGRFNWNDMEPVGGSVRKCEPW